MTEIIITVLTSLSFLSPVSIEAEEEPSPIEFKVMDYLEGLIEKGREEYLVNSPKNKIEEAIEEARIKKVEAEKEAERLRARKEKERLTYLANIPQRRGGTQTVKFTNYYSGDSTGAKDMTAVGLTSRDFKVNHMGWYTYQGDVVLAGATNICLDIKTGVCGQYNSLPSGYASYDLRDRISFTFEGQTFSGIVIDTCGACFWQEAQQRVDIYVADGGQFGTKIGEVHH